MDFIHGLFNTEIYVTGNIILLYYSQPDPEKIVLVKSKVGDIPVSRFVRICLWHSSTPSTLVLPGSNYYPSRDLYSYFSCISLIRIVCTIPLQIMLFLTRTCKDTSAYFPGASAPIVFGAMTKPLRLHFYTIPLIRSSSNFIQTKAFSSFWLGDSDIQLVLIGQLAIPI